MKRCAVIVPEPLSQGYAREAFRVVVNEDDRINNVLVFQINYI
jgi:hypothetical protein